jgi:YD repeat-containing protein
MKMRLFAVAALSLCALTTSAAAQSSCSVATQACNYAPAPPGSSCYGGMSFFCTPCTTLTYRCAPPNAPDMTCPGCSHPTPPVTGGKPINLATGNTYIVHVDVSLPGLGGGISLTRTWNSKWPQSESGIASGFFGTNWRSNYEERIFVENGYVIYARGDGSFWIFGYASGTNGSYTYLPAAPANASATLTNGTSNWTLTYKNGEQRLFANVSGSLTSIIDRNGNTTNLTYDSMNRLVTVTDAASRHLYFTYQNNSSYLITAVTSDFGISLQYAYDAQGRLTQVTRPDNTQLNFQYDSNSMITAVTDMNGKVLESHTYDSAARGLTSSRANGVDALTVSYPVIE